jgi:S-ribosylhomocysteine lyase LuxS involved in autoinducer biosynthesis
MLDWQLITGVRMRKTVAALFVIGALSLACGGAKEDALKEAKKAAKKAAKQAVKKAAKKANRKGGKKGKGKGKRGKR